MIPAIDPGAGLTEERPAPRASQAGSPGFNHALERAEGPDRTTRQRSPDEARRGDDNRARDTYGERRTDRRQGDERAARDAREGREPGETRARRAGRPEGDAQAAREGRRPITDTKHGQGAQATEAAQAQADLQDAAQKAAGAPLQPAEAQAAQLAKAADDPAVAALSLQFAGDEGAAAEPGGNVPGPGDATPVAAQIGNAAYRLGVHGKGEAQLAQGQGLVLPGTLQAQMLGQGVQDVRQASLRETDPAKLAVQLSGEPVADETDVLQVSTEARAKQSERLSHTEQVALQTAQARNEVLSRLMPGSAEGNATGETAAGAADALRQHLQFQGLLARNARAHALEQTAQQAPQTMPAGVPAAAGSVDLTQVFETPRDDAVHQRVLERVANEARWLLNNERQEVTFRLKPDHLGSLHMKVHHRDGVYRIEMTVDNHAARQLLESNLQDLRNRLAGDQPGGEFHFNVDVRQGNEQPSLHARSQQQQGPGLARAEGLDEAPAPGTPARVLSGTGGVSIYA